MGRGIALLFHDRGTRRGERSAARPGRTLPPLYRGAGCVPGPFWTGGRSRPHRDSIADRPARSSVTIPPELPVPRSLHTVVSNYSFPHTGTTDCHSQYNQRLHKFGSSVVYLAQLCVIVLARSCGPVLTPKRSVLSVFISYQTPDDRQRP